MNDFESNVIVHQEEMGKALVFFGSSFLMCFIDLGLNIDFKHAETFVTTGRALSNNDI